MFRFAAMLLMMTNTHAVNSLPTFACEIEERGLNGAVSRALGSGFNADGWIEGVLVIDFHLSRDTAENAVNTVHTALFGGPVPFSYGECE